MWPIEALSFMDKVPRDGPHNWGALETGQPGSHLRVPGRCAEKRHHDGLVGTQLLVTCYRASALPDRTVTGLVLCPFGPW